MTDGLIWGERHFSRRFLAFLPRSSYDVNTGRLICPSATAVHGKQGQIKA
ncbi:hypothetical protein [Microcystis aeruginosa]|nr:hypothetical protein [Microcystis aeruginosa]